MLKYSRYKGGQYGVAVKRENQFGFLQADREKKRQGIKNMLPGKKVVVVSEKKSFFVVGLMKKLTEMGIQSLHAFPDTISLGAADNGNDPIVYFAGDELYRNRGMRFIEDLREQCLDEGRLLILIGDESEYQKVTGILPKTAITRIFPRVVKMDELLRTIKGCMLGDYHPAKRHHILIVDDDVSYMRMLHGLLKDIYDITMLDSGERALEWLAGRNKVDLILLDYEMPVEDGPEVFSRIKQFDYLRSIPIIFLTGKRDRNTVLEVLGLHPQDYILKSVNKATLIKKLEVQFEKKQKKQKEAEQDFRAECEELLLGDGLTAESFSAVDSLFTGQADRSPAPVSFTAATEAFPETPAAAVSEAKDDGRAAGTVEVPMMGLDELQDLLDGLDF